METRRRGQVGAAVMPPPVQNDRIINAERGQTLPPSPARLSRTALDGPLAAEYNGPSHRRTSITQRCKQPDSTQKH